MASSGATALLPPVKSVVVYKNGDPFFSGRRFIVNQRQVSTMESFLNDVTLSIGAPLAVRTLYTPRNGHRVPDLENLQQGAQYVAAGFERFRKMENGDVLSPTMRFIIPRSLLKNLEQILSLVSEKAMLRTGAVRRLCTLDGVTVTSGEELESGQCYVAVGTERFKKLPYVELLLNKAPGGSADRHYIADRGLHRRSENRKFPQDSNSDSALLHSPERDSRRVKSTGDEAEPGGVILSQPLQRREGRGEREESSIFYAKPVRVRKYRPPHRAVARNTGQASVFKGVRRRREEVQGAEEVAEDEGTAVELPVDQRVAEVVHDEEIDQSQTESTNHMHQTGAPDERTTSSPHSSLSPSDREHLMKEYRSSEGDTSLPKRSFSLNKEGEAQDEDILSEDLEKERGQNDENGHHKEAGEAETQDQDHARPPSSISQQRE